MLLLAYLYHLSERQTEVMVNDSISMKGFVGLAVDEPAPDHSTLTAFKRRIIENGGLEGLEEILGEVVRIAQEAGDKEAARQRVRWRARGIGADGEIRRANLVRRSNRMA